MLETTPINITDAEWEIMRVVWANVSATSRDIIDVLGDKMGWKESTIKTLVGRLVEKEALNTEKEGRKYIYTANLSEADTVKSYSEDILSRVCNKHNGLVVSRFIEDAELSTLDIDELILMLEEKKKTAPEVVSCQCVPGQCECHLVG